MYYLKKTKRKLKGKVKDNSVFNNFDGIMMNSKRKAFSINGENIINLKVVDYQMACVLAMEKASRLYKKLINNITFLLNADDESGECYREALNLIEKFRLQIKNKYREFLEKEALKEMAKQLKLLQKETNNRYLALQEYYEQNLTSGKSR